MGEPSRAARCQEYQPLSTRSHRGDVWGMLLALGGLALNADRIWSGSFNRLDGTGLLVGLLAGHIAVCLFALGDAFPQRRVILATPAFMLFFPTLLVLALISGHFGFGYGTGFGITLFFGFSISALVTSYPKSRKRHRDKAPDRTKGRVGAGSDPG